jgi:hypothetical protein
MEVINQLLFSTVQYCTVLFSTVQYCSVLFSTVQYIVNTGVRTHVER